MKITYLNYGTIVLFVFIASITSCKNTIKSEANNSVFDSIGETIIDVKEGGTDDLDEDNKIEEIDLELNTPDQVVLKYIKWKYKFRVRDVTDEELFNIGLFTSDFLEKHPRVARLGCDLCAGDVYESFVIKKPIVNGATATVSTLFCWQKTSENDGNFEERDILLETNSDCAYDSPGRKIELWKIDGEWLINTIN